MILNSVQSRLLQLQDSIDDTFSECIRLALLAFHSWTTKVPSVQFRATYLEARLETSWRSLDDRFSSSSRLALQFWVGVVAAGLLSGSRKDWLTDRFNAAIWEFVTMWREANNPLMQVEWINGVDEDSGGAT